MFIKKARLLYSCALLLMFSLIVITASKTSQANKFFGSMTMTRYKRAGDNGTKRKANELDDTQSHQQLSSYDESSLHRIPVPRHAVQQQSSQHQSGAGGTYDESFLHGQHQTSFGPTARLAVDYHAALQQQQQILEQKRLLELELLVAQQQILEHHQEQLQQYTAQQRMLEQHVKQLQQQQQSYGGAGTSHEPILSNQRQYTVQQRMLEQHLNQWQQQQQQSYGGAGTSHETALNQPTTGGQIEPWYTAAGHPSHDHHPIATENAMMFSNDDDMGVFLANTILNGSTSHPAAFPPSHQQQEVEKAIAEVEQQPLQQQQIDDVGFWETSPVSSSPHKRAHEIASPNEDHQQYFGGNTSYSLVLDTTSQHPIDHNHQQPDILPMGTSSTIGGSIPQPSAVDRATVEHSHIDWNQQQQNHQFTPGMDRELFKAIGANSASIPSESFLLKIAAEDPSLPPPIHHHFQHDPTPMGTINQQPPAQLSQSQSLLEALIVQNKLGKESYEIEICYYKQLLEQKIHLWKNQREMQKREREKLQRKIANLESTYTKFRQAIPINCPQSRLGVFDIADKGKSPVDHMTLNALLDITDPAIRLSLYLKEGERIIQKPSILLMPDIYERFGDNDRLSCFLLFKARSFFNMSPIELYNHIYFLVRDGDGGENKFAKTLATLVGKIGTDLLKLKKELIDPKDMTFLDPNATDNSVLINAATKHISKFVDPMWNLLVCSNLYKHINLKLMNKSQLLDLYTTAEEHGEMPGRVALRERLLMLRENALKFIKKAQDQIGNAIAAIIKCPVQAIHVIEERKEQCRQKHPAMFDDDEGHLMSQQQQKGKEKLTIG